MSRASRPELLSWGRTGRPDQEAVDATWRSDPLPARSRGTLLPRGLGRSYGDSCENDGGTLLLTRRLDRFIELDRTTGLLRCEAGVTFEEILALVVPHGWFLPVTPGTKFVTVGGAIANDVHGKNHHRVGTFGRFVRKFELLRSDGARLACSATENPRWYEATIGGLGLTGLVTWAEIQLRPIANPFIEQESIKFGSLAEFFELNAESEAMTEYTVSWIDVLARGKSLGRGQYLRGNHAAPQPAGRRLPKAGRAPSVPIEAPNWAVNPITVRGFNEVYFHRQQVKSKRRLVHYDPFFYPLDAIGHWNRIYGKRGFFQYQCIVPHTASHEATRELIDVIAASKMGSFLNVLKTFGDLPSPGLLSFPRSGVTLALDFGNHGQRTLDLFDRLDSIVAKAGGSVYPAKDARMPGHLFRSFFPQWEQLLPYVDPRFSSSFWRRVTADAKPSRAQESA